MQERMEGQEVANRSLVRMNPEDEIKMRVPNSQGQGKEDPLVETQGTWKTGEALSTSAFTDKDTEV